jgi:hypothetical protein
MADTYIVSMPVGRTATLTQIAASATTGVLLAANPVRKAAYVYNDSSANLYVAFAATATTSAYTVKVPAATLYEMPLSPAYQGIISGIWDSATGNARITEVI